MTEPADNPKTTSSDYEAMVTYWHMVNAILGGAETMRAPNSSKSIAGPAVPYANLDQLGHLADRRGSANQSPYLPKFPNENPYDYELRRRHAPFTDIYGDISRSLSSKPFSKTLDLDDGAGEDLKNLANDIDGQGNKLHVFAATTFKSGLDKGISWILVDYTNVPANATTLADERNIGARPYWVQIEAERVLAVYSSFLYGREIITQARIDECAVEPAGYSEVIKERVRVFNREAIVDEATGQLTGFAPATWALFELVEGQDSNGKNVAEWVEIGSGPVTIGVIPLVPFVTGKRKGAAWRVEPPLRSLAFMQVEEFQQESNLKSIKELTAFPMLAGNGVDPPKDNNGEMIEVPVGPKAVVFAPPSSDGRHGEWTFIEPNAASLTFLQIDLEKHRTEMRDLGMQPLSTANLTVITTANVSLKAHSAVQAWAIALKDALETAWRLTCMWTGQKNFPTVNIHTDFGVEMGEDNNGSTVMQAETQGIISKKEAATELQRFGLLRDDYDWDEDQKELADQQQGLEAEQPIDPRTGMPLTLPGQKPAVPSSFTAKSNAPSSAVN